MEKAFITTTFMLFWVIGISVFWLQTVILFTVLAIILSTVDIITWILKSRIKWEISSIKMTDWILKKSLLLWIIFFVQVVLWHSSYLFNVEWLSIIWLLLIVWYTGIEFISILENISEMKLNKYEAKMFKKIHKITEKVLNRVDEEVDKRIEKK